jgi:hypothetical protein
MRTNAWITLLAYEARIRHAADCRRSEETNARLDAVRARVLADLRCAIALDVEVFLHADSDRSGSALTCHDGNSAKGFAVSHTDDSICTRRLTVDLQAASLSCRYDHGGSAFSEASHQRAITIEIGNDGAVLSLWDEGLVRSFATVEALSAFLLAPIFDIR